MKEIRIGDFTITEFVDVETYFRNTGLLDYRLEDLQDFNLEATQEEANITGRGGRVIGKKKKNKSERHHHHHHHHHHHKHKHSHDELTQKKKSKKEKKTKNHK